MQNTEDTLLFQLFNYNELIVLDDKRYSVRKDKSRRANLPYLSHWPLC